jgi:two-component system, chemotaxis family, chemotaxis protein CheY
MTIGELPTASPDVLIVDDDPDVRHALELLVADAGLIAISAVDGAQAVRFTWLWRPRLMLLDLHMPVMDGWELLEKRRCDTALSRTPVVIISSEAVDPALLDQVQGWVPKPIDHHQLERTIAEVLHARTGRLLHRN